MFSFLFFRIMIDGEAAFSDKNVDSLNINDLKVVRVWPSTGRKVYIVERAIRTVKYPFFVIYCNVVFLSVQRNYWKDTFHKANTFVKMGALYTRSSEDNKQEQKKNKQIFFDRPLYKRRRSSKTV